MAETAVSPSGAARAGFTLTLPPAARAHLTAEYARAETVLEYGSGGSTFVAMEERVTHLFSVESDGDWAERVRQGLADLHPGRHHTVLHVDIGPTGKWGRPLDASGRDAYPGYAARVWDLPGFVAPDVVLIDGRFRAACFIETLRRCTKPTTVLFDDYLERPYYHWVETFARPARMIGRMAHFEVEPGMIGEPLPEDVQATYYEPR